MDRPGLAAFLRSRREALVPADVGLPSGPRRRAPGLRREEVAQLTGMSVDYLTRLEQSRGPQPSPAMLTALARTLRLTDDERDYLFRVAGHAAPDRLVMRPRVAPALLRVLDRLQDTPALVISALGETLVANDLAVALFGDPTLRRGLARHDVYRWFTDASARRVYPEADHDRQSRALVSGLRSAHGLLGARSRAGELAAALTAASPEFVRLWEEHGVARRFEDHKVLLHPETGPLELDCQVLFTEDQLQALLVLTAAPGTAAADRLALLRVLGTQPYLPAAAPGGASEGS